MALLGFISIGMGVNSSGLKKGLAGAARHVNSFQAQLSGLGKSLAGLAAGFGLMQLGKGIIGTAVGIEKSMTGLAKATDLDPEGLGRLKKQILDLSTTLKGVSVEGLMEIATSGAKLGIAQEDLLAYTEGIAKLSTAMDDVPVNEIADAVGKINVVFKLGVNGAQQLGSAIDKIADSGVSTGKDVMDVTARISGMAKITGISAQESIALAGALLDTGTEAEAAAGSINKLLSKVNDAGQHKDFAKAMGISAEEFGQMVKTSPMKAVQGFLDALGKMDGQKAQETLGSIGISGVREAPNIMKLGQQAATVAKYVGYANSEFKTLNQINQSYNATAQTTAALWENAKNHLKVLADGIGQALLPAINAGLGALSGLAKTIGFAFKETVLPGIEAVATRVREFPQLMGEAFGPGSQDFVRGLAESFVGDLLDKIDRVAFAIRNIPDIIDISCLQAQQVIINLGETFLWLKENIAALLDWLVQTWPARFGQMIEDSIQKIKTLSFTWKDALGLNGGIAADTASKILVAQAKKPGEEGKLSLKDVPHTDLSGEIGRRLEALGAKEEARRQRIEKERKDLAIKPGGKPAIPEGPKMAGSEDEAGKGPKLAAALDLGSKEAYSAIAKARMQATGGDAEQRAARQRDEQLKAARQTATAVAKIATAVIGGGAGALVPMDF